MIKNYITKSRKYFKLEVTTLVEQCLLNMLHVVGLLTFNLLIGQKEKNSYFVHGLRATKKLAK